MPTPPIEMAQQGIEQRSRDEESSAVQANPGGFDSWALCRQLLGQLPADGGPVSPPQDGAVAKTFLAGGRALAACRDGPVAAQSAAAAVVASSGAGAYS